MNRDQIIDHLVTLIHTAYNKYNRLPDFAYLGYTEYDILRCDTPTLEYMTVMGVPILPVNKENHIAIGWRSI